MIEIIIKNPFRILGCYCNSSKKDIVANKGKIVAFLKVNRSVDFPLDLNGLLPKVIRNLEMIDKAEAHLAIAKEQIKYAQFWWVKDTTLDETAFRYLEIGHIDSAFLIWSKHNNLSALQNRLLCTLIKGDIQSSISIAENLYSQFGDSYISKIDANCTLRMKGNELLHLFIDSLGEEIGMQNILKYELAPETKAYITGQTTDFLVKKIILDVEKAKRVDHNNPILRKEAGHDLMSSTMNLVQQLKKILGTLDQQYQMVADKLGLEILQCSIDYFNNSEDEDAAQIAMLMQKCAQSIVVGTLAIQRCNENVSILQNIIDKMPPKEILSEAKELKGVLAWYTNREKNSQNALELLKKARSPLISIKEKLGKEHSYYLEQSSIIGSAALNYIIEEVNNAQKDVTQDSLHGLLLNGMPYCGLYGDIEVERERFWLKALKLTPVLRDAWQTIVYIDLMDKTDAFHLWYQKNRKALFSIINSLKGFEYTNDNHPFKGCAYRIKADIGFFWSDSECFQNCNSKNDYRKYIQLFPTGKHLVEAREKIKSISKRERNEICLLISITLGIIILCFFLGKRISNDDKDMAKVDFVEDEDNSNNLYNQIISNPSEESCKEYLQLFNNTDNANKIREIWLNLLLHRARIFDYDSFEGSSEYGSPSRVEDPITKLKEFISQNRGTVYGDKAQSTIEAIYDSLYRVADEKSTESAWRHYQRLVPTDFFKDSESKIEEIKNRAWNTESKAWQMALSENSISAFTKYKSLYPNGSHISQCEKKLIDLEVSRVYAGEHGSLPEMDRTGYGGGPTSYITVTNSTSYTLTLLYSGPDSKRLVISAGGTSSVRLKNGSYRVAASVSASNVSNYAGKEKLQGGNYSVDYYISTYRY